MSIDGSKHTNDISSPYSPWHHGLTDRRPITSRLNWPIRSIARVYYHHLPWHNSFWLWRWLPHRLSKRNLLSTTVLFTTTFTRTIIPYLLRKWHLSSNLSQYTTYLNANTALTIKWRFFYKKNYLSLSVMYKSTLASEFKMAEYWLRSKINERNLLPSWSHKIG